jgi:hypothetical protein
MHTSHRFYVLFSWERLCLLALYDWQILLLQMFGFKRPFFYPFASLDEEPPWSLTLYYTYAYSAIRPAFIKFIYHA